MNVFLRVSRFSIAVSLFAFLAAPGTFGQSTDTLEALERLDRALEKEKGLNPETRDALKSVIKALRAEREGGVSRPVSRSHGLQKAVERLTFSGDFRLRHESNIHQDGRKDRNRERMRFRIGAQYQLNEQIGFGARLRTGNPDDPNNPHQDLGQVFNSFEINLDRLYATYKPEAIDGLSLSAGKFSNPVVRNPVYGELAWDADVQPEGVVGVYSTSDFASLDQLRLVAGGFTILEQSNAQDAFAFLFQGSARKQMTEHTRADLALAYYLYGDPTPDGAQSILTGDNAGNATVDRNGDGTADDFQSHFGILNPMVAVTCTGWEQPVTVAFEYLNNVRADNGEDQGYAIGASVGKAKVQGDWRLFYQWQKVEQDAVFSAFAQDDFLLQTNFLGHVFGLDYRLLDSIGVRLWALTSARDTTSPGATTDSDQAQWRLRLDVNVAF